MKIQLYMDQGVVADLRHYKLYSGQFSTCAPIVLFNAGTNRGGLYHFAGGAIRDFQERDLRKMRDLCTPTDVYIFRGNGDSDPFLSGGISTTKSHIEGVRAVFTGPSVKIHNGFDGTKAVSAIYVRAASEGVIKITFQDPGDIGLRLKTAAAIAKIPAGCTFLGESDDEELSRWRD